MTHPVAILYPVKSGIEILPAVAFLAVYVLNVVVLTATVSTEFLTDAVLSVDDALAALFFGAVSLGAVSLGAVSLGAVSLGVVSLGAVSHCYVPCSAVLRAADFRDDVLAGDTKSSNHELSELHRVMYMVAWLPA